LNENDLLQKYSTAQFQSDLEYLGIQLSQKQLEQFLVYYEMLAEWNQVMNLTAITEMGEVVSKHFVDSLSLVRVAEGLGEGHCHYGI